MMTRSKVPLVFVAAILVGVALLAFAFAGGGLVRNLPAPVPTPAPTLVPTPVPTPAPTDTLIPAYEPDPIPDVSDFPTPVVRPGTLTGTYIADNRPQDIDFLSLTQSGSPVVGYLTIITTDGKFSTKASTTSLTGSADYDTASLTSGSILGFGKALYTARIAGNQLTFSYPTQSGEIGSRAMRPASQEEFNEALHSWQRDLALAWPYLGVETHSMFLSLSDIKDENGKPVNKGELVNEVVSGGPAERAGLKVQDVILQIDSYPLDITHPLTDVLAHFKPGDTVTLTVLHDRKRIKIEVTLGHRPAP